MRLETKIDLGFADIRREIQTLRSESRTDNALARSESGTNIADLRREGRSDYRWLLGLMLGGFAALLGVMVAHGFHMGMSAERLRAAARSTLNWSQRGLAAILGRDERQVRRWMSGAYEVPTDVLHWAETLAEHHRNNPPPLVRE